MVYHKPKSISKSALVPLKATKPKSKTSTMGTGVSTSKDKSVGNSRTTGYGIKGGLPIGVKIKK